MKTILISAYACEPGKGSEPGVGWNWAKEISKNHKVIVLTRMNNRNIIESELASNPNANLEFVYYDVPHSLAFWKKGQRGVQLYYILWQAGAYRVARRITREREVDIVLALTFGNMWLPTFMYKLPCSFIWGPLGGGEGIPSVLWNKISLKQKMYELFRSINPYFPVTNIWFRSACRKANALIVRTKESMSCIPEKYRKKCSVMIETGVEEAECRQLRKLSVWPENEVSFIIIGRLVPFKFVDIGIRAFAKLGDANTNSKLHIVGDGECKAELQKLAISLGVKDKVVFHGKLDRETTLQLLSQSFALLMPSAREGGAWVLFEAMMCGKPIICMDTTGMSAIVTHETGIKIPVCSYTELIDAFAEGMMKLLQNRALAVKMGEEGYKRILEQYLWREKRIFFEDILNAI